MGLLKQWLYHAWDMAQRVAMQIAEKPPELREAAFGLAERSPCESAKEWGGRRPD